MQNNFGNARFFVPNNRSSSRSKVAAYILIRYKDERKDGNSEAMQFMSFMDNTRIQISQILLNQ